MKTLEATICPNCLASVPASEVEAGWCENCGKKLPSFVLPRSSSTLSEPSRSAKAEPKKPSSGAKAGQMVGGIIGGLIVGILYTGPLRSAGYLVSLSVTFVIFLITCGIGRAIGSLCSSGKD